MLSQIHKIWGQLAVPEGEAGAEGTPCNRGVPLWAVGPSGLSGESQTRPRSEWALTILVKARTQIQEQQQ